MGRLFLFFILTFGFPHLYASHIAGGVINYECLGNNQYRISLTLYRDCKSQVQVNNGNISIYNQSKDLIHNLSLPHPGAENISATYTGNCFSADFCMEEIKYTTVVTLPPSVGGYTVVHQQCCRNNPSNIIMGWAGSYGSTFFAHIPGSEKVTCNSNPVFKNLPPVFLCAGLKFEFDHSAIDKEGDQLIYSLCELYNDDGFLPSPFPAKPPPYLPVPWNPPYHSGNPMGTNAPITIDPQTGLLTIIPNTIGRWAFGVCVREYRNGILLSETTRDYQVNIIPCLDLTIADFIKPHSHCSGFTFDFINTSFNANSFFWDFGDGIISTAKDPVHTFSSEGTFPVMLIANPGSNCADTMVKYMDVFPVFEPDFNLPDFGCFGAHSYDFFVTGSYSVNAIFQWSFSNADPPVHSSDSVYDVRFDKPGIFSVQLVAYENGCYDTIIKDVEVFPDVIAGIGPQDLFCNGFFYEFENLSHNADSCLWIFGDPGAPLGTTNIFDPSFTFPDSGKYPVTLITFGKGCNDTVEVIFNIYPYLDAQIGMNNRIQCFDDHLFHLKAMGDFQNYASIGWLLGTGSNIPNSNLKEVDSLTFRQAGTHQVLLTITENGCTSNATVDIVLHTPPVPKFTPELKNGCSPLTMEFINMSISDSPLEYSWDFGDGVKSSERSPVHVYRTPGSYDVKLRIKSNYVCIADTMAEIINAVTVFPKPVAGFSTTPEVTSILEPEIEITDHSTGSVWNIYYFSDGGEIEGTDVSYFFSDTGTFFLKQVSFSDQGCTDTAFLMVKVSPEYSLYIPDAFTPNDDGLNDFFLPVHNGVTEFEMSIFNRLGEQIFFTKDLYTGWDGTYRSQPAQNGVYIYKIYIKNILGEELDFSGKLTLIR